MMNFGVEMQAEMKINLPFKVNTGMDCGCVGLQMVAEYLDTKTSIDQIRTFAGSESSGSSLTIGLSVAAQKLALSTHFYTLQPTGAGPSNFNIDYYTKYHGGEDKLTQKGPELLAEALALGVAVNKGSITLIDILANLSEEIVPIVLLDWNRVTNDSGYFGHFVPIVGWDRNNVLVHQPGLPENPQPFFPIDKQTFELARKAAGTDEDILFIGRQWLTKISISATTVGITS